MTSRLEITKELQRAIETMGSGFLSHPRNGALRERLHNGDLTSHAFYCNVLEQLYGIIFVALAAQRTLPKQQQRSLAPY